MDMRAGFLILFLLSVTWVCNAEQVAAADLSRWRSTISDYVMQVNIRRYESVKEFPDVSKSEKVCSLCEAYATEALMYLSDNSTQTMIMDILHQTCSQIPHFKQKCTTLVDQYVPLFFLEVSSMTPEEFCQTVHLCQQMVAFSSQLHEDNCQLCHQTVSQIIVKLKDPDTRLEILKLLLQECNSMDNYAKKCKLIVIKYGPLILTNLEKFLESNDVCTMIHACGKNVEDSSVLVVDA